MPVPRAIVSFRQDEHGDFIAVLACGHSQHVRHKPPWQLRPWVMTEAGRAQHLGVELQCSQCDRTDGDTMDKPGDRWASGDAYEAYMGRWSRVVARVFLDWLAPAPGLHWLDVGCGTGALTSAIARTCRPASVLGCDPSAAFIEHARATLADAATFSVIPSAEVLPARSGGFDMIVSGLMLNFVPDPVRALSAMRERAAAGGTIAAYVWDYSGMELINHFWQEVALFDRENAGDESRRFASWQLSSLGEPFAAAGLAHVETGMLEIPIELADFDDYWKPFLAGTGPAPAYVAALDPQRREELRARLERRLPASSDGRIRLRARALAVRARSR
jgi:SAM-dependent methyltransferase